MFDVEGKFYGARMSLTKNDRARYYQRYLHFKAQGRSKTWIAARLGLSKYSLDGIVKAAIKDQGAL